MRRLAARRALVFQCQASLIITVAQARKTVHRKTQAFPADEVFRPDVRFVAVHMPDKVRHCFTAQHGFYFLRTLLRQCQIPLGRQAGMYHGVAQQLIMMEQGLPAQPVNQFIPVGCAQDGVQCVVIIFNRVPICGSNQVQVVVAEYAHSTAAKIANETQCFQLVWSPVYQVAGKPALIVLRVETDQLKQGLQFIKAALNITNGVNSHDSVEELMQGAGNGEGKSRDFRVKLIAIVSQHLVGATHAADGCGYHGATGVLKTFTRIEMRLFSNNTFTFYFLDIAVGVRDDPVSR